MQTAIQAVIPIPNAPERAKRKPTSKDPEYEHRGKRPHYMHFIFGRNNIGCTASATYTESSPPIPPVPASNYRHHDITKTLRTLPQLFKVITPINPNCLEELLVNHPNKDLVSSFCNGLRHGFWPFADTKTPDCPSGVVSHAHRLPSLNDKSISFLKSQQDVEMGVECYSKSFGANLLPGMVAQPIFTVPKKGSAKL